MFRVVTFNESSLGEKNKLDPHEIHVWIIQWKKMQQWILVNWNVMEPEDRTAVSKYRYYDDCMRSAAGRLLARTLLAEYSELPVNQIRVRREKYGKPIMESSLGRNLIKYSVSHSGEMVVLAFTKGGSIGIDIEEQKRIPEYKDLASNIFAPEESSRIIKSKNSGLFYTYWTAKEAYLKALGLGLSKSLKSFYIEGTKVIDNGQLKNCWKIIPIKSVNGYCISIAVERKGNNDDKISKRLE